KREIVQKFSRCSTTWGMSSTREDSTSNAGCDCSLSTAAGILAPDGRAAGRCSAGTTVLLAGSAIEAAVIRPQSTPSYHHVRECRGQDRARQSLRGYRGCPQGRSAASPCSGLVPSLHGPDPTARGEWDGAPQELSQDGASQASSPRAFCPWTRS